MSHKYRTGFTLVEIMIVVAIIAIIYATVITNYVRAGKLSAKNVCISNLRQIDGAIERWALENDIPNGIQLSAGQESQIYSYIKQGKPLCPSGGTYTIYPVGAVPDVRCSREDEGHRLPS